MSLQNFIPTIWAGEILNTFEKSHVLAALCNRDYEGEIKGAGDTVKINSIGEISVSSYVKNSTSITPEELQTAQTTLLIDQSKYFAFKVDDVDAVQANVTVMQKAMQKAAYKLSETVDAAIGGLYASAANTVTDATFDSALAFDTIAKAAQHLNEEGVPKQGRWLVMPPWAITKLLLAKILNTEGSVSAENELSNGFIGTVMGFKVYESNNLYQTGTTPNFTTYALAGVPEAISYAEQIVKVEAFRPESSFSDAVKGLHVYGYKVVQPKGLVALCLTYSAETT
jgi:hypothetical protein